MSTSSERSELFWENQEDYYSLKTIRRGMTTTNWNRKLIGEKRLACCLEHKLYH